MNFEETAQSRFDRQWAHVSDDRKVRTWDQRPRDRRVSEYFPHVEFDDEPITPPNTYLSTYSDIY